MTNLPEYVEEDEVKKMFACADKNSNGVISYQEFTLMCKVPDQQPIPTSLPSTTGATSSTVTNMTNTVVSAVNGMLKNGTTNSVPPASGPNTSTTPVATVVTVTTSK